MSLVRKSNQDTADRQLFTLPDMPVIDGVPKDAQLSLSDWWTRVREALVREDNILRDLIGGVRESIPAQPAADSGATILSISGGSQGVTREEVEQIVNDSVSDAITNARYTHSQGFPSTEWLIIHNLGWKPSATVIDSAGNEVCGDVRHESVTQLRISFTNSFSGYAYLT